MALLALNPPDKDAATGILQAWRNLPELSDAEAQEVIAMWHQATTHGFFAFVVSEDGWHASGRPTPFV